MNTFLTQEITTKFSDIIPLFLFSFTSMQTRRAYSNDLKSFLEFLKKYDSNIICITQVDQYAITGWKNELEKELKLHATSVRRKLNCISALFEFAKKRKYLEKNPTLSIKKPQYIPKQGTNALTQQEMENIFEAIKSQIQKHKENSDNYKYANRKLQSLELHYAVLHVLCATGLRVSELCKLQNSNFEIQKSGKNSIYILHIKKAKGSTEHKVFLNSHTAQILLEYQNKYRYGTAGDAPLFVRVQNKSHLLASAITPRGVYEMLKEHALKAQISKKISPHSIRAGVATILHGKGVPIARIQKQLGHSDIATTSVYIKKADEVEESAALKLDLENFLKS